MSAATFFGFSSSFLFLLLISISAASAETLNDATRNEEATPFSLKSKEKLPILFRDPTYLIMAPRAIRAGKVYRLVVNILEPSPPLLVRATIYKDNIELAAVEHECESAVLQMLEIMIPGSSSEGDYRLLLEGNEVGWLTGSSFSNETRLAFIPVGATVLIQTDRPVYKQGDSVLFRVVAVDTGVRLVEDSVDVLVLSPRGVLIRRWPSRQCRDGAVSLEFSISPEPEFGKWTIRVETANSYSQQTFRVENFDAPRFQVEVELPPFLSADSDYVEGTVMANYTSGAPVTGNVTLRASVSPIGRKSANQYGKESVVVQHYVPFNGVFPFKFLLSTFDDFVYSTVNKEIKVTATVGDAFWDVTESAFAVTRVHSAHVRLRFLGGSPQVLKSAMPFKFYLTASLEDGSRLPQWKLLRHRLIVSPEVTFASGHKRRLLSRNVKMTHTQFGMWESELDLQLELGNANVLDDVSWVKIDAQLRDSIGKKSFASLVVVAHHSPHGKHLQVSTSTLAPKVGEYIIFHVRSNFYHEKFRFVLMSKGMIIEADQESMQASLKTFPLALTSEMAGSATIVVYALGRGSEELVADSLTFSVDTFHQKKFDVQMYSGGGGQDEGTIGVHVTAEPGSRVSLTGSFWSTHSMQAGNEFTHAEIMEKVATYEGSKEEQSPLRQRWSSGWVGEKFVYKPRSSPGVDSNLTFTYSDMLILSDDVISKRASPCREEVGQKSCLLFSCYSVVNTCDGKWDCTDGADEKNCREVPPVWQDVDDYRIRRKSRTSQHYLPPWLWKDIVIGPSGSHSESVLLPNGGDRLVLNAFSFHPTYGLTILPEVVEWKVSRDFWLWVEVPERMALGEQVGLRVTASNFLSFDTEAVIVLTSNPAYRFVNVEDFDKKKNELRFTREISGEGHEHRVEIGAGESHTLYLPIVPARLGNISITVQASFSRKKLHKTVFTFVEATGMKQEHHTSLMIDLRNRAYFFTFLDVNASDAMVPKSSAARLSVFGDTVGAALDTIPVTSSALLDLPDSGCEAHAFGFLLTLFQLKYRTEKDQTLSVTHKSVLDALSPLYQTILSYQNNDGGFRYFRSSPQSSVWVTAVVVRALHEVALSYPHYLYVDPQVTDKGTRFLIDQQASHGAWWEPSGGAADRKFKPSPFSLNDESTSGLNISLTAYTILNLASLRQLPSPLDGQLARCIAKARTWLEGNLELINRASPPLEIALVALVLQMTSSSRANEAFEILARNSRQESYSDDWLKGEQWPRRHFAWTTDITVQYVYWGEDLVPLPSYRIEAQRPYLQPRSPHRHDSSNVAATAYALRVYTSRGEVMTPAIVRWLQTQRAHSGGWMSTQDTLTAWEALYEYAKTEKFSYDTDLTIIVEPLHDHALAHTFHVTEDNLLDLQTHDFEVSKNHHIVRVQGKGRGTAILQLTSRYHVAEADLLLESPKRAFSIGTRASARGRNVSSISFDTCFKWLYTEVSDSSGLAVLEATIPTGYGVSQAALRAYVASGVVSTLRGIDFRERKIWFFLEKVTSVETCLEFSVERWFPVANLTRILPFSVYEYHSPELYAVELIDISEVILDICQVCGSYQCPNCPVLSYYSSSGVTLYSSLFIWTLLYVVCVVLYSGLKSPR